MASSHADKSKISPLLKDDKESKAASPSPAVKIYPYRYQYAQSGWNAGCAPAELEKEVCCGFDRDTGRYESCCGDADIVDDKDFGGDCRDCLCANEVCVHSIAAVPASLLACCGFFVGGARDCAGSVRGCAPSQESKSKAAPTLGG